jgi:carbamoyl-phosphate synthase large subunit
MKNILVTGAGAVLGQGILRCLQEDRESIFIHTCDPDWRSSGHWLGDKAHKIPMAKDENYISTLEEIIKAEKIDLIFIGTDSELPLFSIEKSRLENLYNIKIIISSNRVIQIANDKWLTAKFLQENGFPYPKSFMTSDIAGIKQLVAESSYPYFAKPIDGARSLGIKVIYTERDLLDLTTYENNLVVQEFLPDTEGEFTSGCIVFHGVCKAVVTLKRDLRDGNTYRAYYNNSYSQYDEFISEVACKLGVEGPCNFQFRIKNGLPVIFEINSRFSGTTPLRYFFGFNEVHEILYFILYAKEISKPSLKEGMVMRVWSDLFIDNVESTRFENVNNVSAPKGLFYHFNSNS